MNQLCSLGIKFDDGVRALLVLPSLSNSWNELVTTMSNTLSYLKLNFDDVVESVLNEKVWRKVRGETLNATLNVEAEEEVNKGTQTEANLSQGGVNLRLKGEKGRMECWNYGKKAHFKKDCKAPKKSGGREQD